MQTDFTQLYSRLGLEPGCTLPEFKQAYRRQFAELHPDRPGVGGVSPQAQDELREIIALYGSALSFHRRHGRLPGATPRPPSGAAPHRPSSMPPLVMLRRPPSADASDYSNRSKSAALLLAGCVLLLVFVWISSGPHSPLEPGASGTVNEPTTSALPAAPPSRPDGGQRERASGASP